MYEPKLFTSKTEINKIKENIIKYKWYRDSFNNLKEKADILVNKGFSVPTKSGYVFYETCSRDNTTLIFDPYKPYDHICPTCKMNYKDKPYNRAWITQYHAWLSQMSIYVGIVYQILKDETYSLLIKSILLDYVKYYDSYPNNDNELGPTKVFQSTYMESVWIMHLACAYDMVKESNCFSTNEKNSIETNLFKYSAKIIIDYDEGVNNRQAFNNGGILAVGYLINDKKLVDYALYGKNGFINHMKYSVLEDGFWYEGDNYHFATLPSMISMAEMCRHNGLDLYNKEFNGHTIEMMYSAPLKSLQPDLTFPSRKDSGYASHIAQQWYAGLYELAYSRYRNLEFSTILKTMYAYSENENYQAHNAAGIMDVFKSTVSMRHNLDWRGFLNAVPDLGEDNLVTYQKSVNMSGTGLAVLRNNKDTYASLDYGDYGGGHGHPDRLNLNFLTKKRRWLCDIGTCNYYFDQLKWYRSTIAHNTITVDGQDHLVKDGICSVFETTIDFSLAKSKVYDIAPGVDMERTIILFKEDILFDFFTVESNIKHLYHFSLHSFGTLSFENLQFIQGELQYENYNYINELKKSATSNDIIATFKNDNDFLVIKTIGEDNTNVYSGRAYGPPNEMSQLFPMMILERNIEKTSFVSIMETNQGNKVIEFSKIREREYMIITEDGKKYVIAIYDNHMKINVIKEDKLITEYNFKDKITGDEKISIFSVDEWIPLNQLGVFNILLKNNTENEIELYITLINEKIKLKPFEERKLAISIEKLYKYIKNENIDITYSIIYNEKEFIRHYKKAYTKIKNSVSTDFLTNINFMPNLTMDSIKQVRRGEKKWEGINDVSAKAMICNTGDNMYIDIKIKDDSVQFDGGKFPFDNDSIQVYIDRRDSSFRKVGKITKGVYGILVVPGVNDNPSTIVSIDNKIVHIEKIGVSTNIVSNGYEITLMIPWECLGGLPIADSLIGFDVIVNDRDSGVRRDLQMLWSGCLENERIYLREDSHNPIRFGLLHI